MKKYKIFIFSFLIILVLLNFKIVKISGNSMSPTLKSESFAVVDKYLHKLFTIQKGDILLIEVDKKEVVKKIVGFPGETINIFEESIRLKDNEIYILGENLSESIDSREYGPINYKKIIGKVVVNF